MYNESTLKAMQKACARGGYPTYIECCAQIADDMVAATLTEIEASKLIKVAVEMGTQVMKFGKQHDKSPEYWLGILMEEVGEAAKSLIEYQHEATIQELIQVAAVAVHMADYLQVIVDVSGNR
jgi:NTP pyrophosphatase (non-canonical NTP hydrolase)